MDEINIDGKGYDLSNLSDKAKQIIQELKLLDANFVVKQNTLAAFQKAKSAYALDLKDEIIKKKAGLDF